MNDMLQIVLNGLCMGSAYALFSLGYSIIYSLLGIVHLGHGAILSVGAYVTWSAASGQWGGGLLAPQPVTHSPFHWVWAVCLGVLVSALLSCALNVACFQPLRMRKAPPLMGLVASLGASLVWVNLLLLFFGAEARSFPPETFGFLPDVVHWGEVGVRGIQLFILGISSLLLLLLVYAYSFLGLGPLLRSIAEDPLTSQLLGVPVNRVIHGVFGVAGAVAGLSGILLGSAFSLSGPYFGMSFGLKGLAVIVLGGLGSLSGTVLAGFTMGIAEALLPQEFSGYKDAVAFSVLGLALLIRPQGFLGKPAVEKV